MNTICCIRLECIILSLSHALEEVGEDRGALSTDGCR